MFSALFKQTPKQTTYARAQGLYSAAMAQTREPVFYTDYGVPDSFDGRFDLLLVHLFLILNHVMKHPDEDEIEQALFDVTFHDMDQTLREVGIGDMGVPKHMRRMMKAFNGRMHAYQLALEPGVLSGVRLDGLKPGSLEDVLRRNVYATTPDVPQGCVQALAAYVVESAKLIKIDANGAVHFAPVQKPQQALSA